MYWSLENVPWTNLHDLNLDWIVNTMKQTVEQWIAYRLEMNGKYADFTTQINSDFDDFTTQINSDFDYFTDKVNSDFDNFTTGINNWKTTIETEFSDLQTYVQNYFDNLDLNESTRYVINQMIASGEFVEVLNPSIVATVESWLAEHITPTTPVIDNTLTISGAAADAKVTGDKITELKTATENALNAFNGQEYIPLLFSKAGAGAIRATNGTVAPASTLGYTDYIDIEGYSYISYKRLVSTETTTTYGMAFYDVNKAYISGEKCETGGASWEYQTDKQVINVPNNAKYARFTYILNETNENAFGVNGLSKLFTSLTDIANIKNTLNGAKLIPLRIDRVIKGQYVRYSDGILILSSTFNVAYMVPVSEMSRIYYRRLGSNASTPVSGIAFYDSSGTYISGESAVGSQATTDYAGYYYTDVPPNAAFVNLTFFADVSEYGEFNVFGEFTLYNEKFTNLTNQFISNGYITTNVGVGNTVDVNNIVTNGSVSYLITPCKLGDYFYIRCRAGSSGLPWCFIDDNYKIVSTSAPSVTINTYLTSPCNGFLIVHGYTQQFRCVFKAASKLETKHFVFPACETPNYYNPINTDAISSVMANTEEVEPSSVYELYDNLMSDYSDLITKDELPYMDESGTYNIYCYTFNANDFIYEWTPAYEPPKKPVIIIGTGIHGCGNAGDDHAMIGTLYLFLKDMCENWKENNALSYIRNNFILKIIPLQNPWGQKNKNRQNSNGVDINRNMPFGWFLNNDPTAPAYGGTAPLSENESKNLAYVMENTENVCLYIDLHSRIGEVGQTRLFYATTWQMSGLMQMFNNAIYDISRMWTTMSQDLTEQNIYGFIANNVNSSGTVCDFAYPNGFLGLIYEGFSTFTGYTGTAYDETITKMNLSYLGTMLLRLLYYIKSSNTLMLPIHE